MKVREQNAYSTSKETVGTAPAAWSLLGSWTPGQSLEQPSAGCRLLISLVLVHPILICHSTHSTHLPIEWDALSPLHRLHMKADSKHFTERPLIKSCESPVENQVQDCLVYKVRKKNKKKNKVRHHGCLTSSHQRASSKLCKNKHHYASLVF